MSSPLSIAIPTAGIKTAMPELADKTWVRVKLAAVAEDNMIADGEAAGEKKPCISFRFDTIDPAPSSEGKTIEAGKAGGVLFERVYLRDKNNITSIPDRAIQSIGKVQDALDNTGDADNTKGLPARVGFDTAWVAASIGKIAFAFVVKDGDYGMKIKELKSTQDPKFAMA